jgi:hypothetical protein
LVLDPGFEIGCGCCGGPHGALTRAVNEKNLPKNLGKNLGTKTYPPRFWGFSGYPGLTKKTYPKNLGIENLGSSNFDMKRYV